MTADSFNLNATFGVELAVFIIVLVVVARFVIRPLQSAMHRRQAEIEDSLAKADRVEELLAATEVDYEAVIDRARQEARRIIDTAHRMAGDASGQTGQLAVRNLRADRQRTGIPSPEGTPDHPDDTGLSALSNLANRDLSTIEQLDTAYSATRALIALQNNPAAVAQFEPVSPSPTPTLLRTRGRRALVSEQVSAPQ